MLSKKETYLYIFDPGTLDYSNNKFLKNIRQDCLEVNILLRVYFYTQEAMNIKLC